MLVAELPQNVRLCADRVTVDLRRPHIETRDIAKVIDVRLARRDGNIEVGKNELPFELRMALRIQQRNL